MAQHSSERLGTSLCQCGKKLASSPWAQPEAEPSLARAWLWLLVPALVLGKQRGVRAPSSLEDSGMLGSCGKSWSLSIMRVDGFRPTNWLPNE